MKFGKPQYNAENKVYLSDIKEGFRCEADLDDGEYKPPLTSFLQTFRESLVTTVIESTKGWFSKPLTVEWLRNRIEFDIPTESLNGFEGHVVWQAQRLTISKEKFIFHFGITETKEAPKVVIDFQETTPGIPLEVEDIPLTTVVEQGALGVGPTRRRLFKQRVMQARARAAKALFRAEQLTVRYCETYGDDTDWEEDEDEDSVHSESE